MPASQKKAYLLVILGVVMVSYSGPLVKGALLNGATPITVAFLRMLFSGFLLLPFSLVKKQGEAYSSLGTMLQASSRQLLFGVLAAFFLALHYLAWMTSLGKTTTFASVALVCTQPLFVSAFSGLLLREHMPKSARVGAVVAIIGAVLIGANSLSGMGGDIGGDLLALFGAVTMAGHWLCGRYARKSLPTMGYTVFVYLVTALILVLMMPVAGGYGPILAVCSRAGSGLYAAGSCSVHVYTGQCQCPCGILCTAGRTCGSHDMGNDTV